MKKGAWLNVGSSSLVFPGIISLDKMSFPGVKRCDIRLGLPYPDASAEVIIASHVLEHLNALTELPSVLKEFHRVLMPSGVLRVAVPDLEVLASAYAAGRMNDFARTQGGLKVTLGVGYEDLPPALRFSAIAFGNYSGSQSWDGHHFCADFAAMRWLLERAGFTEVRRVQPGESRHPDLMGFYKDIDAPEQIIVEATRP